MKVPYKRESYRDFHQRYNNTYGYLLLPEGKKLIYLTDIGAGRATFVCKDNLQGYIYSDTDLEFEFIPVTHGWVTNNTDCYLLARVPDRQWKRGVCEGNTAFSIFHGKEATRNVTPNIFNLLESVSEEELKNSYMGWKAGTRTTCVLSKHFSINSYGKVFFFDKKIGSYTEGGFVLDSDLVSQELRDLLVRRHINERVFVHNV